MASRLQDVILRGLAAARPLATAVAPGTLYYSSDTEVTERSDGVTWESYSDAGGGGGSGGITQLTGDVTAGPGVGSQVATLVNTAVVAGSYTNSNITVDAKGRLTAAATGSSGGTHAPTHSSGGSDPVTVTNLAGYPGGTVNFLRADATFSIPPVTTHGTTHSSGGSDPVDVKNLAGYPGGTTTFLRADSTFASLPSAPVRIGSVGLIIDGGASVITTGVKAYLEIPFGCTIQAVTLLADVSGSIVIDIWKDTYANYPPVVGDSITASAKPTISSALKSQDNTLTGWTTSITAGDILGFNVDSVTSIKRVTLSLKVQAT